jgi:hypothetical protein
MKNFIHEFTLICAKCSKIRADWRGLADEKGLMQGAQFRPLRANTIIKADFTSSERKVI